MVHVEVLRLGQTVKPEVYSQQLTRVQDVFCRQGIETSTANLPHDKARHHIAEVVQKKIEELGWTVSPQPAQH